MAKRRKVYVVTDSRGTVQKFTSVKDARRWARLREARGLTVTIGTERSNPLSKWTPARAVRIVKRGSQRLLQILVPRRRKR